MQYYCNSIIKNYFSELADIVTKFDRYRGNIKSKKCFTVLVFSFKNSEDDVLFLKAFEALSRLKSICQVAEIVPNIIRVSKAIFPVNSLLLGKDNRNSSF